MLTEEGKNENFPCVTGVLLEQRGNRRTEHPRKQQNTKRASSPSEPEPET